VTFRRIFARNGIRRRVRTSICGFGSPDSQGHGLDQQQTKAAKADKGTDCLIDNHFHPPLVVPPNDEARLCDEEMLKRLSALCCEAFLADVTQKLIGARTESYTGANGMADAVSAIHNRYTSRMRDLAVFMKGLFQRLAQWFNRAHSRPGTLWEDRLKSVIVECGVGAWTMAAYLGLNPNTEI
jgi:putative transposase